MLGLGGAPAVGGHREKAKDLLRMAVSKAVLLEPLEEPVLSVTRSALVVFVAALTLMPRGLRAAAMTEIHYVMGTYFQVTADDHDTPRARAAMQACFAIAREVDRRFSRFDPSSELSALNASAAEPQPVAVSEEMAALLRRARMLQGRTGGAFDVSVSAATQLWRTSVGWPPPAAVAAARQTAGAAAFDLLGATLTHALQLMPVSPTARRMSLTTPA